MSSNPSSRSMHLKGLHNQQDEGYSEDMHSQADDEPDASKEARQLSDPARTILRSIQSLPPEEQIHCLQVAGAFLPAVDQLAFIKQLLCNTPTWMKQEVSSHLDSLMYFDPVLYFPYEIVQTIFSHLNLKELLNASVVSRGWREHAQDEKLWRQCFVREGWQVDTAKIRALEASRRANTLAEVGARIVDRKDSRKRRREEAFLDTGTPPEGVESDIITSATPVESMDGVESTALEHTPTSQDLSTPAILNDVSRTRSSYSVSRRRTSVESTRAVGTLDNTFKLEPTIWQTDFGGVDDAKISWAYLYKHRRMLERNWDDGRYVTFRLPHPKYESEGHAECVYTIQHVGSTLVSGSRDRTIRVWNLDTCRLRGPPLRGHDASVLCLQFDPSPQNDIIVSGGSDSWVIIWRFSTGEIIKKLTTAHTESVLNLRFDDRFIITCSKDKTIKLWNRRAITAANAVDLPAHVLPNFPDMDSELLIKEYTLISVLTGHQAAVNAVMIHDNVIVSASGDRVIKAWNINTGKCERTYTGHTKGIACVQYDGRRIVSGSSDNTVRIFDADQQAEVACLQGHHDLVRTVQARFGDLQTVSDEDLHDEARKADMQWSKAMQLGVEPASGSRSGRRNAGSSRPEDILAVGARVPPGGGGTKWARIVSGSYDESVVIWKRDREGQWMPRIKLQQDPWLQNRRHPRPPAHRPPPPPQPNNAAAQVRTTTQTMVRQNAAQSAAQTGTEAQPTEDRRGLESRRAALLQAAAQQRALQTATQMNGNANASGPAAAGLPTQPAADLALATAPPPAMDLPPLPQRDSNRVFKLQFDARRIVCCSQNRVIMGWDFANGNEDLARVGSWCEETY